MIRKPSIFITSSLWSVSSHQFRQNVSYVWVSYTVLCRISLIPDLCPSADTCIHAEAPSDLVVSHLWPSVQYLGNPAEFTFLTAFLELHLAFTSKPEQLSVQKDLLLITKFFYAGKSPTKLKHLIIHPAKLTGFYTSHSFSSFVKSSSALSLVPHKVYKWDQLRRHLVKTKHGNLNYRSILLC